MIYTLLERGLLGSLRYYPSTGNAYVFARNIFTTLLSALITGILEIIYFSKCSLLLVPVITGGF
jgi:hypothetical protein